MGMVFMPVPPPRFQPSPRAQDLSRRLAQVIEEFERQYPGTSREDVQQAMELAVGRGAGRRGTRRTAVVAAAVVAAVASGAAGLITSSTGRGIPAMAILVGIAVMVAIVVVVRRMRKE
jgi:hypothetical protein